MACVCEDTCVLDCLFVCQSFLAHLVAYLQCLVGCASVLHVTDDSSEMPCYPQPSIKRRTVLLSQTNCWLSRSCQRHLTRIGCSLVPQVDSNWVRRWNNMKYYAMLALAALVCAKYCMYMLMVGVLKTDRASYAGISYVRFPNLRILSICRTIKS